LGGLTRASHQTAKLCILLLPVWIFGAGDLARFVRLNTVPGDLERNGMVKGRDFVAFYVSGTLAREGNWNAVYNLPLLKKEVGRIVPAAEGQVGVPGYPPQLALLLSPLSKLSYLSARWTWLALSALLYLVSVLIVVQSWPPQRARLPLVLLTAFFNPALPMLLSTGQTAALAVTAWALAAGALRIRRFFTFGLCLGLLIYKPPMLIGVVPALIIVGYWRSVAGLAASAAAQCTAVLVFGGAEAWRAYFNSLAELSSNYYLTDTLPHQKHSLIGFFRLLAGPGFDTAILATFAAAGVLGLWYVGRDRHRGPWLFPMLAATSVLLSPHFYVYDLIVLVPALLVVAALLSYRRDVKSDGTLAWAAYALLYAPFSGVFALHSRVQLSVIALAIFLVALHRKQFGECADWRAASDVGV
jgi:hypothetical protein